MSKSRFAGEWINRDNAIPAAPLHQEVMQEVPFFPGRRSALRCLRPGGMLSSLGVYSGKLELPPGFWGGDRRLPDRQYALSRRQEADATLTEHCSIQAFRSICFDHAQVRIGKHQRSLQTLCRTIGWCSEIRYHLFMITRKALWDYPEFAQVVLETAKTQFNCV